MSRKNFVSGLILALYIIPLAVFGLISFTDTDPTVSEVENRSLEAKPPFTWQSWFSGEYSKKLALYYADTFPEREKLMSANQKMSAFYAYKSDEGTIIDGGGNQGQGSSVLDIPDLVPSDIISNPSPTGQPSATPTPATATSTGTSQW
ncbi:hypothetical protein FACS1894217_12890 [Clostridia bacterium]|nr:hypothetical protein FACS1894217_12890 [Clostridia bacterium]